MNNFMNYDFNITDIKLAIYVKPGTGVPIHRNRPFHGLAINISTTPKLYIFPNGKTITVEQNEIIYLPKGSDYTAVSNSPGNCYAINFNISENISFEPFSFKIKNVLAFIKEYEKATKLWKNKSYSWFR